MNATELDRTGTAIEPVTSSLLLPDPSEVPELQANGGGGEAGSSLNSKPPLPPPPAILLLTQLQKNRMAYIGAMTSLTNRSRARVRSVLGWRFDMTDKERERVRKEAATIVKFIETGKWPKERKVRRSSTSAVNSTKALPTALPSENGNGKANTALKSIRSMPDRSPNTEAGGAIATVNSTFLLPPSASLISPRLADAAENARVFVTATKVARDVYEAPRLATEEKMIEVAKALPVWPWASAIPGMGNGLLLAIVVAEAGNDLANFPKPGHLWKRLGLAAPEAYTITTKDGGTAKAIPRQRRSQLWVVQDVLTKHSPHYLAVYRERKAYELARAPEMRPIHAHKRAGRFMVKRFVKDLWLAWRAK